MTMTVEPLTFDPPQQWGQQTRQHPATTTPDDPRAQDPGDPQHLHPSRPWIIVSLITATITTLCLWGVIVSHPEDKPLAIICQLAITIPSYLMVLHGLFYRIHIDEHTITTRLGPFTHHVDAHHIRALALKPDSYVITDDDGHRVRINHYAYNVDRALLNLLIALDTRPIDLPEGPANHPDWPDWAQNWRNIWATTIHDNHTTYFTTHPNALTNLNTLVQPPDSMSNASCPAGGE